MGFREDIETILSYIPDEDRQTVLFSATMPKPILEITRKFQHDATTIKVTKKELTVPNIDQYYYDVRRNDKMEVLTRLLIIIIQSFRWYFVIPSAWWMNLHRSYRDAAMQPREFMAI